MTNKSEKQKHYSHGTVLTEGRSVVTDYFSEKDQAVLIFSRRLTPEVMGEYRSIQELNEDHRNNFELSKNRRSLISVVPLSTEAAFALKHNLRRTLKEARRDIRKKCIERAKMDWAIKAMTHVSGLEEFREGKYSSE